MIDGLNLSSAEWVQVELAPELDLIAPAVRRLTDALAVGGADQLAVEALRLAVSEALANSIRHGRARAGCRDIELAWSWQDPWLEIRVSEPGEFIPPARWSELPEDPLSESGRGGFLIAQALDEFAHQNVGGRHTLRLRKRLGPRVAPADTVAELEKTLGAMTEDLSASYETLSALFRLAEALATTEDLAAFAEQAFKLRSLVEADAMHVRLADPNGLLRLLGVTADESGHPLTLDPAGTSLEAEVFRTGTERTTDEKTVLTAGDPLRAVSGVTFVCPIYFQSKNLGVCVLSRSRPGVYFTAAQLALARSTAEFLGIACANADLQKQRFAQLRAQRELEIAAQIQQSLLPVKLPVGLDWEVHGVCANALETGGDFYDVIEVEGGLLLVMADVMGKGMPAALLAVVLRTALRSHAALARTPGKLLTKVNAQLAPDLERLRMFITVQAVFLEAHAARICYANAGHWPIIALRGDGAGSRLLEESGLPIGVTQAETYAEFTDTLEPRERLILLTDGMLEATDDQGRELGLDGLVRVAQTLHGLNLEQTGVKLLEFVNGRDGGRLPLDDRTLLVAQRPS